MKTSRTLVQAATGLFATSLFAALALAGPGPQYFNRTTAQPAAKPAPALKSEAPVAGKCDGCKTTTTWAIRDRGPAGKGVPGASIVGSQHSCARCTGAVVTQNGKTIHGMTHSAVCGPVLCCK